MNVEENHHHLQGLSFLACSDLPVRRIDPSISFGGGLKKIIMKIKLLKYDDSVLGYSIVMSH
jgi:hypothetical protein